MHIAKLMQCTSATPTGGRPYPNTCSRFLSEWTFLHTKFYTLSWTIHQKQISTQKPHQNRSLSQRDPNWLSRWCLLPTCLWRFHSISHSYRNPKSFKIALIQRNNKIHNTKSWCTDLLPWMCLKRTYLRLIDKKSWLRSVLKLFLLKAESFPSRWGIKMV